MLWWAVLANFPTGLEQVDCPVILAQGTLDVIAAGRPRATWRPFPGPGSCPCSAPGTRRSPTCPTRSCGWSTMRTELASPAADTTAGEATVTPLHPAHRHDERVTS
jgi:hypothetical protein